MWAAVEVFKTFFGNLWVEHLLYLCSMDDKTIITLKKFKKFCSSHDWDTELYLDQILKDDDYKKNVEDMLIKSRCGCDICSKLKDDAKKKTRTLL